MDKRLIAMLAGSSVISAAAGVAAGYKIAVKRLTVQYDEELERQMAAARKSYESRLKVRKEFETPQEAFERLHPAGQVTVEQADAARAMYAGEEVPTPVLERIVEGLRAMGDESESTEELTEDEVVVAEEKDSSLLDLATEAPKVRNLFEEGDFEETVQEYLLRTRDRSAPYVVTREEFFENENDYEQTTLHYYEECGTVADEKSHLPNSDDVVGDVNMDKFGLGSGQQHVVYIRNEALEMDFEVARNTGSYAKFLGLQDDPTWVRSKRRSTRGVDG